MPFRIDERYTLHLKIPDEYVVESFPQPLQITLSEKNGFKYLSEYNQEGNTLVLSTKLKVGQTLYPVEAYPDLKEFFDRVVEAMDQKVVLKRK